MACVSWVVRVGVALGMAAAVAVPWPGIAQQPAAPAQQSPAASTEAAPAWKVDLEQRHAQLLAQNGPGTEAALRTQLLQMGAQDQQARGLVNGQPVDKNHYTQAKDVGAVDARLTAELQAIVAKDGWPTIALVGGKASNAAMLILIHTRDHAWQRSLLPQLEQLADAGKIDGSYVATLVDKELVSEGKLQRYGTQFKFVGNGQMAMYGVEDPSDLDARRAKVFLPPMAAYEQLMSEMYHLKVSNKIVMAAAPAAQ